MNVLLLSIGAKYSLVGFFRSPESGFDKIVTTDCSEYAAGLYNSDVHYVTPRMDDHDYIPTLLDICTREDINVIIPLREDELLFMSDKRDVFGSHGITLMLSSAEFIQACKDKYLFYNELKKAGIPVVPTYLYGTDTDKISNLQLPLYAKPRYGAASIGNIKTSSREFLDAYIKECNEEFVVQPYISGDEFGVDVYVDLLSHEIIQIFIKKKLSMKSGETEKSVSVKNDHIVSLVQKVVDRFSPVGVLDMDVLFCNGEYKILEINPRFGGGYPHAFSCGVNYPLYISNNARDKKNTPCIGDYAEGIVAMKYTKTLTLDN